MKKFSIITHGMDAESGRHRPGRNPEELTLKMGSRMSWQKVLGSFFPSGLVADLLNLPVAGSKYLQREGNHTTVYAQVSYGHMACSACSGQSQGLLRKRHFLASPSSRFPALTKMLLTPVKSGTTTPSPFTHPLQCQAAAIWS